MGELDKLREKYEYEADPDQPTTFTGTRAGEGQLDKLRRQLASPDEDVSQFDLIPGTTTERGTFIPDLEQLYADADPDESIPDIQRKHNVRAALGESVRTEELLRKYGYNVPPTGEEGAPPGILRYITMPLQLLNQIQRPQYATVGALEGILEGDPKLALRNFYEGLVKAEPHSTSDILKRYDFLQESPLANFLATVGGDVILDPLTWLSFGTSALAKARILGEGVNSAVKIKPLLSTFGKGVLEESIKTVGEDAAVNAILKEIRYGSKLGKKLVPSGVRFSHWLPTIGDQSVADTFRLIPLSPHGIIQKTEDLIAAQEVSDQLTETILKSGIVNWFGQAFVPYWDIRRKYPLLVDLDRAYRAQDQIDVAKILEKGKELFKSAPEADRKLISELLENPSLITGKKLATIHHVDPEVPELRVNMDYWPEAASFNESDAEDLVDFFIDVRHRLRSPHSVRDLQVGQGTFGTVYGGARFEPLRAIFENIQAAFPSAKAYKVKFGDWVMKFPIPGGLTADPRSFINSPSIDDAVNELYTSMKLNTSGVIPEMGVVWRKVGDIDPVFAANARTYRIQPSPTIDDMLADVGGRTTAWSQIMGGWSEYLRKTPEEQRIFNSIGEYANSIKSTRVNPEDIHLPILVKRYIKGQILEDYMLDIGTVHKDGKEIGKVIESAFHTIKQSARAAIAPDDLHGANLMLSDAGKVIWVDNARFTDTLKGIRGDFPGTLGSFRPEQLLRTPELDKLFQPLVSTGAAQDVELKKAFEAAYDIGVSASTTTGGAINDIIETVIERLPEEEQLRMLQHLQDVGIIHWDHEGYSFVKGAEVSHEPLSKVIRPFKPRKAWDEQVEVITSKHPALVNASAERQAEILKTYNMAKDWRDQLQNTVVANDLKKGIKTQFTEDDIALRLTRHAIDVAQSNNAKQYMDDVARLFGKPADVVNVTNKAGKTVAKPVADAGWVLMDHPTMKDIQIPKEVAETLSKYNRTFGDMDAAGKTFWDTYDNILGVWKGYATYTNPGFHGRNFASNIFMLYLKNGPNAIDPRAHVIASQMMMGKTGKFKVWGGREVTYEQAFEEAKRYGVYGTGWFGADIKEYKNIKAALAGVGAKGANLASMDNYLFQIGKAAGGAVENEARMVGFILDYIESGNPLYAAQNTKKYLFDYNELTWFDKNVMKRIFPFWAFFKKNAAVQFEQILKQPGKYANIAKVKDAMENQSPEGDKRFLPKYFPELYAVRTPFTTKEGKRLYWNPNLPFQDFNKYFSPTDWLSSVAPWKAIVEVATNKQLFNMSEIQKFEGEKVHAPWISIIPEDIMVKIAPAIGAKKVYDPNKQEWFWGINPKMKYLLEQANPFFKNFSKVANTATGGYQPEIDEEKSPYDVMSWMSGQKLIPHDPKHEVERQIFQRQRTMRDAKRSAIQQGKVPSRYLHEFEVPPTH